MKIHVAVQGVSLGLFAGMGLIMGSVQCEAGPVWINEFHYDNDGGDVDEFVEVAGEAGTDLSGYILTLYNGGTGLGYDSLVLSGILGDESNGFGALSFPWSSMQNGGPDGIALSDDGGFVQFISYEGSFDAMDGPASGLTSIDVGVEEPGTTEVGFSLQLVGEGIDYSDFAWSGPALGSPGFLNSGQTLLDPSSTIVPEPNSASLLLCLGLAGLGRFLRRQRTVKG